MPAFYDFFRKLKFTPGVIPPSSSSAIMTNTSITSTTLNVGTVQDGVVSVGMFLSGPGVAPGTYILSNISGTGNGSTWVVNIDQSTSPTTITGSLNVITQDTVVEADTITDTATFVAGRNITFGVKDTTDPLGLDQFERFTTDTIVINAADYRTYVPIGTTRVRLDKNMGEVVSDVEFVADPNSTITVFRTSNNQIKIGHSAPNIPYSQEQIQDMVANLFANGTHQDIQVNYDDNGNWPDFVQQFSTSGSGQDALFRVSVINGLYEVLVEQVGTGYQAGDTIVISGTNFPNGTVANNITLTVSQVGLIQAPGSDSGFVPIMNVVATGTPPTLANLDILNVSTLHTVTGRGNETSNNIILTNTTESTNKSTGALRITLGGLGVFGNINAGGYIATETQLKSMIATGTAPLVVSSTTQVDNLHAETASRWHSPITVTFATGDMAGSFSTDGSGNVNDVSLTATTPFLTYIENEIQKSDPIGSLGQVPFIKTDNTRLTELDYTTQFGQFIENNDEFTAAQLRFESPSTIFNTWSRFSHDGSENQPANAGELASWTYDSINDRILSTVNSATVIGFISPKTYSKYTHEVRLYSPGGDDDAIGVVIAWHVDSATGRQYTLSAVRSPGGVGFTWQIIYNYGRSDQQVIADGTSAVAWGNGAYGANAIASGYITNQTVGGWDDFTTVGTKVKIVRDGDVITCDTSNLGGVGYVGGAAILTVNLSSLPILTKFRGSRSYGYLANSQDQATFQILGFIDNDSAIYDVRNGRMYVYAGGTWVAQTIGVNDIWTTIGIGRFVYDIYTNKLFYIESGTLVRRITEPLAGGVGIDITEISGVKTITNTDLGSSQNIFKNISDGTNIAVADSNNDTFTISTGSGISAVITAGTDTLTITNTDLGSSQNIFKNISDGTNIAVADSNDDTFTVTTSGSGISAVITAGTDTLTLSNTGVTSLTGTTNRISVSSSTGAVTLNLPQDIDTGAHPTFDQITINEAPVNLSDVVRLSDLVSVPGDLAITVIGSLDLQMSVANSNVGSVDSAGTPSYISDLTGSSSFGSPSIAGNASPLGQNYTVMRAYYDSGTSIGATSGSITLTLDVARAAGLLKYKYLLGHDTITLDNIAFVSGTTYSARLTGLTSTSGVTAGSALDFIAGSATFSATATMAVSSVTNATTLQITMDSSSVPTAGSVTEVTCATGVTIAPKWKGNFRISAFSALFKMREINFWDYTGQSATWEYSVNMTPITTDPDNVNYGKYTVFSRIYAAQYYHNANLGARWLGSATKYRNIT